MKISLVAASVVLAAVVPGVTQGVVGQTQGTATGAMSGVSQPEAVVIAAQADEVVTVQVAPSAATAAGGQTDAGGLKSRPASAGKPAAGEVYGAYVPYGGRPASAAKVINPDAEIVTSVEEKDGELREGTIMRARMKQMLSTSSTVAGSAFTAELTEAVTKNGRVVLPVGSVLEGRVTQVHGGRRISGAAMMHLELRGVVLPDGSHYAVRAQLIDTNGMNHTKVDSEGTVLLQGHGKETLGVVAGTTGAAAVAGGLIAGVPGALVGAGLGAGASTVVWLKQDRQATLPEDTTLVFSLTEAMAVKPVAEPVARVAGGK